MFCSNCGNKIDEGWKCCPICGINIDKTKNNITQENYTPSKEEKKLVLLFFIFFLVPKILYFIAGLMWRYSDNSTQYITIINNLNLLLNLIDIILIIYGRKKYPKNILIKTIFTVLILLISLYLIWTIVFMISCNIAVK